MYIVCLPGIIKSGDTLNGIERRKKEVSKMIRKLKFPVIILPCWLEIKMQRF